MFLSRYFLEALWLICFLVSLYGIKTFYGLGVFREHVLRQAVANVTHFTISHFVKWTYK